MATVVLARAARDALASLYFVLAAAILDALGELERDPNAGHELRGRLSGLRSYRVGAYRSSTSSAMPRRFAWWRSDTAPRHTGRTLDE